MDGHQAAATAQAGHVRLDDTGLHVYVGCRTGRSRGQNGCPRFVAFPAGHLTATGPWRRDVGMIEVASRDGEASSFTVRLALKATSA